MSIKRGFNIKINDQLFYVLCDTGEQRNRKYYSHMYFGLHLSFVVKNVTTGEYLSGDEMRNGYLAEKIRDFVINAINGQRTCYWNYKKPNENGEIISNLEDK